MDYLDVRKQVETQLIKKARDDKAFEQLLFTDPSAALEKVGIHLPEEFNLKVIQENKGELLLVYPSMSKEEELSELELISTAGGTSSPNFYTGPTDNFNAGQ